LLDHTANASGKQKVTSLVQLQTPSFRDLGGSLEAPLLHLQNIEGALGWYKPIQRTEVTIFEHGQGREHSVPELGIPCSLIARIFTMLSKPPLAKGGGQFESFSFTQYFARCPQI